MAFTAFGVAIIRLKEPLKMDIKTSLQINSVCLPSASVNISTNQYAMNGKWGYLWPKISTRITIENPLLDNITDPLVRHTFQRMTFADKSLTNTSVDCQVINNNVFVKLI